MHVQALWDTGRDAYRFAVKLRKHNDMLTSCIERVLTALHTARPDVGQAVAR